VPPIVWALGALAGLFLAALCVATGYAVLRARTRALIAEWSVAQIATLVATAVLPWLAVWLAPITISVNIHTLQVLIGWLALALLAFAVLVLLPLAAVLAVGVWLVARRRNATPMQQNDSNGV
jgi:hypothetical protein